MATASNKNGALKVQRAVRSVVETLEQRQLLAAGQLDYSFWDHPGNFSDNGTYGYVRETTFDGTDPLAAYDAFDPTSIPDGDYAVDVGVIDLTQGIDNRIIKVLTDATGKITVIGQNTNLTGWTASFSDNTDPQNTVTGHLYGVIKHDDIYVARYLPNGQLEYYRDYSSQLIDGTGDWGGAGLQDFGDLGTRTGVGPAVAELNNRLNTSMPQLIQDYNDEAVTAGLDPRNGDAVVISRKLLASGEYQYYMARYEASLLGRSQDIATLDFGQPVGDINDIKVLPDGGFLLVGQSVSSNALSWYNPGTGFYAVGARFYADGTLNTSFEIPAFTSYSDDRFFGVDFVPLTNPNGSYVYAGQAANGDMVVDGYIYVVGTEDDRTWDATNGHTRLIVQRYRTWLYEEPAPTGTPVQPNKIEDRNAPQEVWHTSIDAAFGFQVNAELDDFGGKNVVGTDIKVQPDGKIVVLGNVDQVIDAGGDPETAVVARFNTDGTLDTTLVGGGRAYILPAGSQGWYGGELALQSDGGIIVAGIAVNGGNATVQTTRLDKTGRSDTGFGIQSYGQLPPVPVNSYIDVFPLISSLSLTVNRGPSGAGDDKVVLGWNVNSTDSLGEDYFAIARELTTNAAPTANLQAPDVYTGPADPTTQTYSFTVTYSDDEFVSAASLGALGSAFTGLKMYRPDGTLITGATFTITNIVRMTTPVYDRDIDGVQDAKKISVTYSVNVGAVDGFGQYDASSVWHYNNGLYTIVLDGGIIKDANRTMAGTAAPAYIAGRVLGGFTVNITAPDVTAPQYTFDYTKVISGRATGGTTTTLVDQTARWNATQLLGATVTVTNGSQTKSATVIGMAKSNPSTSWYDTLVLSTSLGFAPINGTPYTIAVLSNDLAGGLTVRGRSYFDIHVVYEDTQSPIDLSLLGNGDIQVQGPRGYVQNAVMIPGSVQLLNADYKVQVTYRIYAPGATSETDYAHPWDSTDNGIYRVFFRLNEVADRAPVPNFIPAGEAGQFNVAVNDSNSIYPSVLAGSLKITPDEDPAANGTQIKAARPSVNIEVTYTRSDYSTGLLDPNSDFAHAIRVTSASGFNQLAVLNGTPVANPDGTYTVKYTISPTDGSWDIPDNSTYTVSLEAGTIRDLETPVNFNQGATLGLFDVAIVDPRATARPTGTLLTTIPNVTACSGPFQFQVKFSPSLAAGVGIVIDGTTSDFANAISVTNSIGTAMPVSMVGTPVNNGDGTYTATYQTSAVDGSWSVSDSSTYTVSVVDGKIFDTQAPEQAALAQNLGNFNVAIVMPTPQLVAPAVTSERQYITFDVIFKAPADTRPATVVNIDGSSVFDSAIVVTRGGVYSQVATRTNIVANADGSYRVTYSISATDGMWDGAENGPYTVSVMPNSVWDTDTPANYVPAGAIGAISVNIRMGRLDYTFYDPNWNYGPSDTYGYIRETTQDAPDLTHTIDLTNGTDNRIVKILVDKAGNTYAIGYSLSATDYPEGRALYTSLSVVAYGPNGEILSDIRDNVPATSLNWRDFNGGGALAAGLTPADLAYQLNDTPDTAAIDPTDGSIVVIFHKQLPAQPGVAPQLEWYMARYSPVANLAQRCLSMTQLTGFTGNVRDMKMMDDGSFVLVGDQYPRIDALQGLNGEAVRYDRNGVVLATLQVPPFQSYSYDYFMGVDVDNRGTADTADDLIYVVGITDDSSWDPANGKQHFVLQRYTATGALDTTFGYQAAAELNDFGGKNAQGWDVKVLPDGKLVVMGVVDNVTDASDTPETTVVARFNQDGTLDTSFLGGGRAYILPANRSAWIGREIAIQSDGGILVSGVTDGNIVEVMRLDHTGRPDTSFGVQSMGQLPGAPTNSVDLGAYPNRFPTTLTINRGPDGSGDDKVLFAWNSADTTEGEKYFVIARMLAANAAPSANAQTHDVYTATPTTYDFTVTYTDDEFMSVSSLGTVGSTATGFSLIAPNGSVISGATIKVKQITRMSRPVLDRDGDGVDDAKTVSVVYTIDLTSLGGFTANGYYTIRYAGGPIADANRTADNSPAPAMLADRTLGGFLVNIASLDVTPPAISFTYDKNGDGTDDSNDMATGLRARGRAYFDFHVVYSDPSQVNLALLDNSDIQVTGPRGYVANATMVGVQQLDGESRVLVTYRILAPNATGVADYAHAWSATYNGLYHVFMKTNQVADRATSPNYIAAGEIAQFSVAIDDTNTVFPVATVTAISPDEDSGQAGTQVLASHGSILIQVRYSASAFSNGVIDAGSAFATAIRVTASSNGFNSLATLDGAPVDNGDGTFTCSYRTSPADGSWDVADNAIYTVSLEANAIRDTENPANFSQQAQLATFKVAIVAGHDARPTASVAPIAPITASRSTIALRVTYSPSVYGTSPISTASLFGSAIQVSNAGGFSSLATLYGTPVINPDGTCTAIYTIAPADGSWDVADNGTYTISLQANTIRDSGTPENFALPVASLASFVVNVQTMSPEQMDARPIATLTHIATVKAARGPLDFTVTYAPSPYAVGTGIAIDPSSDFATAITVSNGGSFTAMAMMQGMPVDNGDGTYTVTYRTMSNDGTWSVADNGTYTVSLAAGKITDTQFLPQSNLAQSLGTFDVAIGLPTATLTVVPTIVASRQYINFYVTFTPPADSEPDVVLAIDGNSDFANAITVSNGGSFTQTASFVSATANADGSYTVRYTTSPTDGSWDVADNGTYTVAVVGSKVSDTDTPANFVPAGTIGDIVVNIAAGQDARPTAALVGTIPTIAAVSGPVSFQVKYSPSAYALGMGIAIDPASDFATAIRVTNGSTFLGAASMVGTPVDNGDGTYTVTYQMAAGDGSWSVSDNGTYTVQLVANKIQDTQAPAEVALAADLGTFQVAIGLPTGQLVFPKGTETQSRRWITFDVNFFPPQDTEPTYRVNIDGTSNFAGAITVTGPGGLLVPVTFMSATANADGSYTVHYKITPADDSLWQVADNGAYTVSVVANTVQDTDTPFNYVAAGDIGTITVNIASDADRAYPSATMNSIGVIDRTQGAQPITVTFAPSPYAPIDVNNSSFAIWVTDPAGSMRMLAPASRSVDGNGIWTCTYSYAPADGSFDQPDNGLYTVTIDAAAVVDLQNPVESNPPMTLGSFTVNVIRPFAVLTPIATITQPTGGLTFMVTYASSDGILESSLKDNNNVVLVTGPNGYSRCGQYLSDVVNPDGSVTVVYRIIAPQNMPNNTDSAVWDRRDNGVYTISIKPGNDVESIKGDTLDVGTLGTFTVSVASALYAGELDLTWDADGYMRTANHGPQVNGPVPFIAGVTQEPGGKLIFSGTAPGVPEPIDEGPNHNLYDFYYGRFLQNGTTDISMSWGTVHFANPRDNYSPANDQAVIALTQSTGRVVIVGRSDLRTTANGHPYAHGGQDWDVLSMTRIYPTGVLDGTFDDGAADHNGNEWTRGTTAYEEYTVDGTTTTTELTHLFVHDAYVQSDDKIVVVASRFYAATGTDWIITRVNANGTLDLTFGTNGVMHLTGAPGSPANSAFESYATDEPLAVVVDNNGTAATNPNYGKILVAGYSDTRTFNQYTGYRKMVVARLNADGTLDTTFDKDGIEEIDDFGRTDAAAEAITLQRDGKIIVAGYANNKGALVRLNTDGSVDGTFGNRGLVQVDNTYVPPMATNPEYAAGTWIPGASVDTSRWGYDVNLQDNGKIILTARDPSQTRAEAFRYFANGTLDPSFGTGGVASTDPADVDGSNMVAYRSLVQSDGKIVIAGTQQLPGSRFELATVRFLGDNYAPQAVLQATNIEAAPNPANQPYSFTVTYSDNFLVNVDSIDQNDVYVKLPNGSVVPVISAQASTNASAKNIVVTYQIAAPGGSWDWTDNGNYEVWQAANEVYDIDGQVTLAAPARNLGAFVVHIDPPPIVVPKVQLLPHPGQMLFGSQYIDLTVVYTDDQAVKLSTIDAADIRVTGPNFFLADNDVTTTPLISVVSILRQDGTPATTDDRYLKVTYRVQAPGNTWDFVDNGTYSVYLKPSQVSDADPVQNYVSGSLTQPIGNVQVAVISDMIPPVATIDLPDIGEVGGTSYVFTVTYVDNGQVNVSTLDDGDIRVIGPNGYDVLAHFVSATPNANSGTIVASYSIPAPGGTWDVADAGTYTFMVNSNQVADTAPVPNYTMAATLGTLNIAGLVDDSAPQASLAPVANITSDVTSINVVLTYTDNAAMDDSSFGLGDIRLVRVGGGSPVLPSSFSVATGTSQTLRTVTYTFTGPGGSWNIADNGQYAVEIQAGQVLDTGGNAVQAGQIGSPFTVAIPDDTQKPVAASVSASPVTGSGGLSYDFSVTWSDNTMLDASSLGSGNVVVIAPDGTQIACQYRAPSTAPADAKTLTATYRIVPPGGTWNGWDNGTYKIQVQPGQIRDAKGNVADQAIAGTFQVAINSPAVTAALVNAQNPLGGDQYMYVTVRFTCADGIDSSTLQQSGILAMTRGALSLPAEFVQFVSGGHNESSQTVQFRVQGPGGVWDYRDTGTYTVSVKAGNPVRTVEGGLLAAADLGTANVSISAVMLVGSELVISGTDDNDSIEILPSGNNIRTIVNNVENYTAASLVTKITVNASNGNDMVVVRSGIIGVFVRGGEGDDQITGGDGNDTLYGNQGNDVIYGGRGDDCILAALGNDTIYGAEGNDSIYAGDGVDSVLAGEGDDYVEGRGKADYIDGEAGNDTIWGGAGNNTMKGGDGNDWIDVGYFSFTNTVDGGAGDNTVECAAGDTNDILTNIQHTVLQ